jgi:hypothetical protein
MTPVEVHPGDGPVVLGMPHVGTHLPDDLKPRLTETGLALGDTDWWVDRLYEGLLPDATVVKATHARYVIDLNRDPTGASLYPGQATTGLCPTTDFDGRPLYRDGADPDEDEISARRRAVHTPYHDALAAALEAARTRHGVAVLYDCHLADRGAAAHADEQPRSRRRRTRTSWSSTAASAAPRATGPLRRDRRDPARPRGRRDPARAVGQAGRVFRTHADAPRVLIANSNLVPHWATWEHFNELDRKGLMMYGQMTAGSWIYIGSQGIVQGTYETFVESAASTTGRPGRQVDPDRRVSAAWAARSRWPRRWPGASCWPSSAIPTASPCASHPLSRRKAETSTRRWR